MRPLCDPWYSATSPLPKRPLLGASSAKLLCGPDTCNLTVAWFPPPSGLMEPVFASGSCSPYPLISCLRVAIRNLGMTGLIRSFKTMSSYRVYDGKIFTVLCCCLAVQTCIAISKVYGNWFVVGIPQPIHFS